MTPHPEAPRLVTTGDCCWLSDARFQGGQSHLPLPTAHALWRARAQTVPAAQTPSASDRSKTNPLVLYLVARLPARRRNVSIIFKLDKVGGKLPLCVDRGAVAANLPRAALSVGIVDNHPNLQ